MQFPHYIKFDYLILNVVVFRCLLILLYDQIWYNIFNLLELKYYRKVILKKIRKAKLKKKILKFYINLCTKYP